MLLEKTEKQEKKLKHMKKVENFGKNLSVRKAKGQYKTQKNGKKYLEIKSDQISSLYKNTLQADIL